MKNIKRNLFAIIAGAFLFAAASTADAGKNTSYEKSPAAAIGARLKDYETSDNFQGVVVAAHKGKIVFRQAYGYADREKKVKNSLKMQFLIGSLTKSFTAVTVMQLVEAGLLDLNAPIKKYIPDLKDDLAADLTLHHLLKQQSGLVPSFDDLTDFANEKADSKDLLAIINRTSRSFKPGTKYEYGNLTYTLSAIAIENATGKTFAEVLRERTFKPLKMNDSGIERPTQMPKNRARGYRKDSSKIENVENVIAYAHGAGDIYTTAGDLLKWKEALFGGKMLSEKSRKMLFDGGSEDFGFYGYGFRIQPYQRHPNEKTSGTLIRHGGTMDGFMSNFHYYLEDDLTVIVLGNIRPFPIRKMTFEIKEAALGVPIGQRNNSKIE